jgi:bifunctional DNA-binding transcriptional regulator/antitoxin component of YhaV-PrlF toxin-antitoxin module
MEATGSKIEETIKCNICLEKPNETQICPHCSKIFCQKCLEDWCKRKGQGRNCPMCRKVIRGKAVKLPWLDNLVKNVNQEEQKPDVERPAPTEDFCSSHGEEISLVCEKCRAIICVKCIKDHSRHSFCSIDEPYNFVLETIDGTMSKYVQKVQGLERLKEWQKQSLNKSPEMVVANLKSVDMYIKQEKFQGKLSAVELSKIHDKYRNEVSRLHDGYQNSLERAIADCNKALENSKSWMRRLADIRKLSKVSIVHHGVKGTIIIPKVETKSYHLDNVQIFPFVLHSFSKLSHTPKVSPIYQDVQGEKWVVRVCKSEDEKHLSCSLVRLNSKSEIEVFCRFVIHRPDGLNQHANYKLALELNKCNMMITDDWSITLDAVKRCVVDDKVLMYVVFEK